MCPARVDNTVTKPAKAKAKTSASARTSAKRKAEPKAKAKTKIGRGKKTVSASKVVAESSDDSDTEDNRLVSLSFAIVSSFRYFTLSGNIVVGLVYWPSNPRGATLHNTGLWRLWQLSSTAP